MAITAPLGVALQPGLKLTLDGGAVITLPFERCEPQGCDSSAALDKAALGKIASGKTLMVHYAISDTASADIPIRLEGLKDVRQNRHGMPSTSIPGCRTPTSTLPASRYPAATTARRCVGWMPCWSSRRDIRAPWRRGPGA